MSQEKASNNEPYYKLYELMTKRYGYPFDRYAWQVAQFVSFQSKDKVTDMDVLRWCVSKKWCETMKPDHAQALRVLFGLERRDFLLRWPNKFPPHWERFPSGPMPEVHFINSQLLKTLNKN